MGKASLGKDYQRRVLELCTKLRAPASFLEAIDRSISEAYMLHFGFEASEKGGMHKIYLEFPLPALTEPTLLHTSYKWDPLRPERHTIGRYVRYPLLSYEETTERVRDLLAECRRPGAFEIADEFPPARHAPPQEELPLPGGHRRGNFAKLLRREPLQRISHHGRPPPAASAHGRALFSLHGGFQRASRFRSKDEVRPSHGRDRQGWEGFFHHPLRCPTAPAMMEKESSDAQSKRGFGKDRLFHLRGHPPLVRVQQRLRPSACSRRWMAGWRRYPSTTSGRWSRSS